MSKELNKVVTFGDLQGEGFVGSYTVTFSNSSETKDTGLYLSGNTQYIIARETTISSGAVKFFNDTTVKNTTKYTRLHGALDSTCYTAPNNGNLKIANTFFNKQSDGIFSGEVTISVYIADSEAGRQIKMTDTYVVNKSNNVNIGYTSTTDIFRDLQFDDRIKTIYIDSGEYDIYQEYSNYQMPVFTGTLSEAVEGFPDYCVYIPKNAHVIGRGTVKLKYMPNPSTQSITLAQSYTVSTVNCADTMTLENVEIYCKNCRYAIHDDALGFIKHTGARKKYINVKCYKYAGDASTEDPSKTYGFEYAFGSGVDKEMYLEFDSCQFWDYQTPTPYASFLLHDRQYTKNSDGTNAEEISGTNCSSLMFRNTIFMSEAEYCVELNNNRRKSWNPHIHIPTVFENCFFSGVLTLNGSHPSDIGTSNEDKNSFDVKLVHCNDVKVDVWDSENEYPVQVYNDYVTEIDYASLKSLRDNNDLIQGNKYRITDYTCTTSTNYTQSAGHLFDIIVTAIDSGHLNEEAFATHNDGDSYFANSNLNAWKLWYCLDNDSNRFAWADTVNGKGVIYRMIDEFVNDVPYDFKNIQFLRGWSSDALLPAICCVVSSSPTCTSETQNSALLTIPCYTFSNAASSGMSGTTDNSINGGQTGNLIMDNKIKPVFSNEEDKRELNNICFFGTINYANVIETEGIYNTFGTVCAYNRFDVGWQKNIINTGTYNSFGQGSWNNDLFGTISNNHIDSNFRFNNTEQSGKFNDNKIGSFCTNCNFTSNFNTNIIGNHCRHNNFPQYFEYNVIGNDFQSNNFKKTSSDSTPANYFKYNVFGNFIRSFIFLNNTNGSKYDCVTFYHVENSILSNTVSETVLNMVRGRKNITIVGRDSAGTLHEGNIFDMIGDINTVLDNINGEVI